MGEFKGVPVGENDLSLSGLCITDGVKLLIDAISDERMFEGGAR